MHFLFFDSFFVCFSKHFRVVSISSETTVIIFKKVNVVTSIRFASRKKVPSPITGLASSILFYDTVVTVTHRSLLQYFTTELMSSRDILSIMLTFRILRIRELFGNYHVCHGIPLGKVTNDCNRNMNKLLECLLVKLV